MPDGTSSTLSLSLIRSNASLTYNSKGPTAAEIPQHAGVVRHKSRVPNAMHRNIYALKCRNAFSLMPDLALVLARCVCLSLSIVPYLP